MHAYFLFPAAPRDIQLSESGQLKHGQGLVHNGIGILRHDSWLTYAHDRAPRQLLTGWVSYSRPIGCPQMTRWTTANWGRALENALKSKGILKDFVEWIVIAKDRSKWRQLIHSIRIPPDA